MCRKHPEVIAKGKEIDISDLTSDPLLRFQEKYELILMPIACFALPTLIPWYAWNESAATAFLVCGVLRYVANLHAIYCINSFAHLWGTKPYDR